MAEIAQPVVVQISNQRADSLVTSREAHQQSVWVIRVFLAEPGGSLGDPQSFSCPVFTHVELIVDLEQENQT